MSSYLMNRYRELTKRQLEIMGYSESDPEFNKLLEEPDLFTQSFLTKTREAKEQLAEATARHKMIIQLEKSIQEICKLFNDMAAMVEQQVNYRYMYFISVIFLIYFRVN